MPTCVDTSCPVTYWMGASLPYLEMPIQYSLGSLVVAAK